MSSLTGKRIDESYLDLLQMDNSNSGLSTSLQVIKDGGGNLSSVYVSDDQVKIKPENDNTTTTFDVQTQSGTSLLSVDTTNSAVKAGSTASYVNTQFTTFGIRDISPTAGYHYPMFCAPNMIDASSQAIDLSVLNMGNSSTPAGLVQLDATSEAQLFLHTYFVAPANITVDSFQYLISADGSVTANIYAYHYSMSTSGATSGDLSGGTSLGSATSISITDANRIVYGTISSGTNVDAGRTILVTIENTASTTDLTCKVDMRWHLR